MGLIDRAKKDAIRIISSQKDFGVPIALALQRNEAFDGYFGSVAILTGLFTKHHMGVNLENGKPMNEKNARITILEQVLIDQQYPYRNAAGEVNFENHICQVKDSSGSMLTYVIREWFPDETIGVIVATLGDYNSGFAFNLFERPYFEDNFQ